VQPVVRQVTSGYEGIKPGWVRVNFNYFIDQPTLDYIIEAVTLIASEGAALLPFYKFEPTTGIWRHRDADTVPPVMSLTEIDYASGVMRYAHRRLTAGPDDPSLAALCEQARAVLAEARLNPPAPLVRETTPAAFEELRWFPYSVDDGRSE